MEFALNNAPELTMLEITKKLFNNNFLSNIEFNVEGKVIFAHSLELMKRSVVFQKQLESIMNKPQVIPIENFTYKSFYEFIRFIYTDDCDINIDNGIELFILATKYKVVKLENQVLDFLLQRGAPLRIRLSLYAFCVTENYQLPYNVIKNEIARNLNAIMELDMFTSIAPNVIEDILRLDCVDENIKEVQIFNGLIRWMNTFCETNQIDVKNRREKFESLLQLIRYPHMTMEEFRESVLNNCDLFADHDLCVLFKDPTPVPKPRKSCDRKYDRRNILNNNTKSETKFTVSKEVLFTGFRYGSGGNHEVKISGRDLDTNNTDVIKLNKKFKDDSIFKTVSLGESLLLKPNTEYIIQIAYDNGGYTCWCTTYRMTGIIIHDPLNAIEVSQPGATMFEIFFKSPNAELVNEPVPEEESSAPSTDNNEATSEPPETDETLPEPSQAVQASSTAETFSEPPQSEKCLEPSEDKICCEESTKEICSESSPTETSPESQALVSCSQQAEISPELPQDDLTLQPLQNLISSKTGSQDKINTDEPPQAKSMPDTPKCEELSAKKGSEPLQDRLTAKLLEATACMESSQANKPCLASTQGETNPKPPQTGSPSEPLPAEELSKQPDSEENSEPPSNNINLATSPDPGLPTTSSETQQTSTPIRPSCLPVLYSEPPTSESKARLCDCLPKPKNS